MSKDQMTTCWKLDKHFIPANTLYCGWISVEKKMFKNVYWAIID